MIKNVCALISFFLTAFACHQTLSEEGFAQQPAALGDDTEHHYFHEEAKEKPHAAEWGYDGDIGPNHWGELSAAYAPAKEGKRQSPIDIRNTRSKTLPHVEFHYQPSQIHVVYNGHTVKENEDPGGDFEVGSDKFELKQFHFHAPSEHTVDGKPFPMEMHLVHKSQDGTSGVVTVFIQEGKHNPAFDPVWDNLPDAKHPKLDADVSVDVSSMLPEDTRFYFYDGSFTTPPCTEQVKWFVLANPISMSKQQIMRFREVIHDNNRPIQPLNGRPVFRSQNR